MPRSAKAPAAKAPILKAKAQSKQPGSVVIPGETMALKTWAAHNGIPWSTARYAADNGKIPIDENGRVPVEAGKKALEELRADSKSTRGALANASTHRDRYLAARAAKEAHMAELRALELAERRRALVDIRAVEEDARAVAAIVREQLLSLPMRVALQIEALLAKTANPRAPEIEALIADEVNLILQGLYARRFGRRGEEAEEAERDSESVADETEPLGTGEDDEEDTP